MIEVRHLAKSFTTPDGKLIQVLRDVNCTIQKGEVISIIGPSGTGKSTFLRALNLMDPPTSGEILLDGRNILEKGYPLTQLHQRMGMVFQNFNLFEHLSILDNVTLGPIKLLHKKRAEAEEEAMQLLRKVGMADKAKDYPASLSGAQKQRAAIARALAMHPEVILFDEPTSALDPTMVGEVLSVIRQLATEGLTMLIVTHEMKFARNVSTRIFFMNEGIIYEDGSPKQIFEAPIHSATKAFVQQINKLLFEVEGPDFDFLDMISQMSQFALKYNIAGKMDAIGQIAQEMSQEILQDYRPLTVRLTHSGMSEVTALDFMIENLPTSPFDAEGFDRTRLDGIRALSKEIIEEPTKRGFRVKVLI